MLAPSNVVALVRRIHLSRVVCCMEDVDHDAMELFVNFFERPGQALGVLGHFQAGGCNAASVSSLAGA